MATEWQCATILLCSPKCHHNISISEQIYHVQQDVLTVICLICFINTAVLNDYFCLQMCFWLYEVFQDM